MDKLQQMLDLQRSLQTMYNKGRPISDFSMEERIEAIRMNVLASEDELHEALNETGWKPWATSRHINREAYVGELVDVWHFFMNLMLHADVTADELFTRYMEKNAKNRKRQAEGYDGVSDKCPRCKRALDDRAVECNLNAGWCELNGLYAPKIVQQPVPTCEACGEPYQGRNGCRSSKNLPPGVLPWCGTYQRHVGSAAA